jgi:hypothetical protein
VAKFGFRTVGVEPAAKVVAGQPVDIVHFAMTAAEWQKNRPGVLPIARYAEAQIRAWDKKQAGVPPSTG